VYELPEMSRTAKGRYLGNVLPLREGETVRAVLATRDYSEADYLLFSTRKGIVKKTAMQAYNTPIKADGIIAINIRDDDDLLAVRRVDSGDEVLMVSRAGLAVRFAESDARPMGRDTSGVRGMDVGDDGEVIAMDVARDDHYLLVVTDTGFGKRTEVSQYRKTHRGAKGVKTITQTEAKGRLAGALVVRDHHQLVFITQNGIVQRFAVRDIRPLGRATQGVRLMRMREDDRIAAVALVVETDAPNGAPVGEPVSLDAHGDADEPAIQPESGDPQDSIIDPDAAGEGPTEPEEMSDSPLED
jgi:DNA gyrase subunit A